MAHFFMFGAAAPGVPHEAAACFRGVTILSFFVTKISLQNCNEIFPKCNKIFVTNQLQFRNKPVTSHFQFHFISVSFEFRFHFISVSF